MTSIRSRLLLVSLIGINVTSATDVRIPPSLSQQPESVYSYKVASTITMPCVAHGSPPLTYSWQKNGQKLDWNAAKISRPDPTVGSITITGAAEAEVGYYQCFVTGKYGTAMSVVARLLMGELGDFTGGQEVTEDRAVEYGQFHLKCLGAPRSVPDAEFFWTYQESVTADKSLVIQLDSRLQVDQQLGDLHFANVNMSDARGGWVYKCNVNNVLADTIKAGSYSRLDVLRASGPPPPQRPSLMFSSPSNVIGLETQAVQLRCFFAAYPTPSITWKKVSGQLPHPRFQLSMSNSSATITKLRSSDAGTYVCEGTSGSAAVSRVSITVDVQVSPMFPSVDSASHDVNTTDGDKVTVTCRANGRPQPTVKWFRNAVLLSEHQLPAKYSLNADKTELTLTDVRKSYKDGSGKLTSDLTVIQCNVSNQHGSAYAQGYINVLEKTRIVNRSDDMSLSPYETATFYCLAQSDDSTPITYRWYFNDNPQQLDIDNQTYFLVDNQLSIVTENDADGGLQRAGLYRCVADSKYSSDTAEFQLTVSRLSASDLWWIVLVVLAILLIIILLIVLFLFLRRNSEHAYPVDEKERMIGNDPVRELKDTGFHDYQRPDSAEGGEPSGKQLNAGGNIYTDSMTGSLPRLGSDADASLSEYMDRVDYGKFREDGSFIGQYNTHRP